MRNRYRVIIVATVLVGCTGEDDSPPGLTGEIEVRALGGPVNEAPRFSDDNDSILGKVVIDGDLSEIAQVDRDGVMMTSFELAVSASSLGQWSPAQSNGFIYGMSREGVIRSADGSAPFETFVPEADDQGGFDLSHDGTQLVLNSGGEENRGLYIHVFDGQDQPLNVLASPRPRLSPDKTRILYNTFELKVYDVAAGTSSLITEENIGSGDWLPDGRVVWTGPEGIRISTLSGDTWSHVLLHPVADARNVDAARDGSALIYDIFQGSPEILFFR